LRLRARTKRLARSAGLALAAAGSPAAAWSPAVLFGPCAGDCAVAVYGGAYVEDSMLDVFWNEPATPLTWDYRGDYIAAVAVSRDAATLWGRLHLEPELGVGQRFGEQHQTELWGAVFFRYRGFPWDGVLTTTAALSTGINWASAVSEVERERAKDGEGAQWMHFFAPEVTFALPSRPDIELLFRFHHRSGVFGLFNDAHGGAQYGTVGLRVRF
jgi:hypothetical protein